MKYLIIDSLARSGTTLFSALLRSQENTVTFDGILSEPQSSLEVKHPRYPLCSHSRLLRLISGPCWPFGHISAPMVPFDAQHHVRDINHYKEWTLSQLRNEGLRLRMGIELNDWEKALDQLTSWEDLDRFYAYLARCFDSEVIGIRWNQCLFYFNSWCNRSPDHYWISLIRHPADRLVSNMKTHGWTFEQSLLSTIIYADKYAECRKTFPSRLLVLHYEDMVKDPVSTLEDVSSFINYEWDNKEVDKLVGADNKPFRPQGWRVKEETGDHRKGKAFTGFSKGSMGQYKEHLSDAEINEIFKALKSYPEYARYEY